MNLLYAPAVVAIVIVVAVLAHHRHKAGKD